MDGKFKLTGDVDKILDDNIVAVKTIRRLRTRVDEHINLVTMSPDEHKKLKEGAKVTVIGEMKNTVDHPEMLLLAKVVRPEKKAAGYKNIAEATGFIYSNEPFEPTAGKAGFTNVLVEAGSSLFSATSFRSLARKWAQKGHAGRGIDIHGHLQRRPMLDREQNPILDDNGNPRFQVELICRDATKNKLHDWVEEDEFAELHEKIVPADAKAV